MWQSFTEYLHRPFKGAAEMDAIDWFLFLGFILVLMIAWRIIFTHLEEAL